MRSSPLHDVKWNSSTKLWSNGERPNHHGHKPDKFHGCACFLELNLDELCGSSRVRILNLELTGSDALVQDGSGILTKRSIVKLWPFRWEFSCCVASQLCRMCRNLESRNPPLKRKLRCWCCCVVVLVIVVLVLDDVVVGGCERTWLVSAYFPTSLEPYHTISQPHVHASETALCWAPRFYTQMSHCKPWTALLTRIFPPVVKLCLWVLSSNHQKCIKDMSMF